MGPRRFALALSLAAVLAAASNAPAGGISDEPCPTVAGENTNTCPSGTLATPYLIRFVEREGSGCGPGKQTFHLDSGIAPPGLTLAADGVLSGTPVQTGRFQFYVEMREPQTDPSCAGERTQKQFTLRVRAPLSIVSAPVVAIRSEVGVPFRTTLRATGGTGIFGWTLVEGSVPAGIRLGRTGSIAGTPRAPGTYGFKVSVRDTEKRVASWAGTLRVEVRLGIRTERLRAARVGRLYRADLRAIGGVGPKKWKLERGPLPRGLRLTGVGRFIGAPREAGTYRVTVAVTDDLDVRSTRTFTIVVREPRSPDARGATGSSA